MEPILYREGTADLLLSPYEINEVYIADARAVLLSELRFLPVRPAKRCFQMIDYAKKHETAVILDIDYRPFGWKNREEAARCYAAAVAQADVVIGNRRNLMRSSI